MGLYDITVQDIIQKNVIHGIVILYGIMIREPLDNMLTR